MFENLFNSAARVVSSSFSSNSEVCDVFETDGTAIFRLVGLTRPPRADPY